MRETELSPRSYPAPATDELRAYVKEQVAAYKYPRKIWFVDEFLKGPTGKILKREIEVPERVSRPREGGRRPAGAARHPPG